MRNNKTIFLILLIMVTISCSRDDDQLINKKYNILYFKNVDEFKTVLEKTQEMNFNELKALGEENGFFSNELIAESIYNQIDFSSLKTVEQVKDFVKNNNDYLQLIEEENGEYTLETKNFDCPFKYLLNEDNLFQIGNKVYKAFPNCLISVDETKIEDLKNADFATALCLEGSKSNTLLQKSSTECGNSSNVTATTGNERIKQEFGITTLEYETSWLIGGWHRATAYHRIWPIWFQATRNIEVSIDHNILVYEMGSNEIRELSQKVTRSRTTSLMEGYCGSWLIVDKPCGDIVASFNSYDTWSKQENTVKAVSQCQ